jgi:hypothetical protein
MRLDKRCETEVPRLLVESVSTARIRGEEVSKAATDSADSWTNLNMPGLIGALGVSAVKDPHPSAEILLCELDLCLCALCG